MKSAVGAGLPANDHCPSRVRAGFKAATTLAPITQRMKPIQSRASPLLRGVVLLLLPVSVALAHGGEDHSHDDSQNRAPAAQVAFQDAGAPHRLADGGLFIPKATQRQMGLRTLAAVTADLAAGMEFSGQVIADPAASGRVQASLAGRIETAPKGLPVLGQRVAKGQILAWLQPVSSGIERSNQQAQLAEIDAQLALAEKKLARYIELEGTIPARELETARIEREALRQRRAALGSGLGYREALTAPVSGVVSAAHVTAGQVVEARETLFEIVDPARLAVEVLAYEVAVASSLGQAWLIQASGALPLRFVGAGRQLRGQALLLLFRLDGDHPGLAVGLPVQVTARSRTTAKGIALPLAALQKGAGGESLVWVKQAPERYAPRRVETRPLDGRSVMVSAGLKDGERVVTAGANLLGQVR